MVTVRPMIASVQDHPDEIGRRSKSRCQASQIAEMA